MNSPKVGDYLSGTWGYDATILTGAVVVAVTGKTVKVRECEQERTYHANSGGMFWTSTPLVNKLTGPVMTKRVNPRNGGYQIKWNSYLNLYLSTPKSVECSNTH